MSITKHQAREQRSESDNAYMPDSYKIWVREGTELVQFKCSSSVQTRWIHLSSSIENGSAGL